MRPFFPRGPVLAALALVTLLTGLLTLPGAALGTPTTGQSGQSVASRAPDRGARDYQNPLAPDVPGDGTVDSCADPTVLKGQRAGDHNWYMHCTTDPLNDTDLDASGNLRFRPIPQMVSQDLVDWTYVGDALPTPPTWAAPGAGLWAPDVVYSRATDRYYLTFVVTDTADSLRGPGACASTSDGAIGVAVSEQPTGPWRVSATPLVPPRPDPSAPCGFFWTFDPDVLGDTVGAESVLYYGSYYGGLHATSVAFTPDGATTAGAPTMVSIGNRYEGTNVVQRGGWYYLFGSATNCCNGPLTSYGVFAGRSRSPMGPFVDREGRSLLAGRVAGTPVVLPNGNRWVGVGHNSVFTDEDGQWWTVYHAIDRFDPYFATDPGFSKRPALLDPLDWVDGWPSVRAGAGPSDERMPAPVTTPDGRSRYRAKPVRDLRLGRELPAYSDDFADGLDDAWEWTREPAADTYGVSAGAFWMDTSPGDLYVDNNTAPVLSRPVPGGDYAVEARVQLDVPPEGCCQNFVQAGFVLQDGDDRFVKLVHASIFETRQTEWAKEIDAAPPEYPRYGNGVVGPPGDTTWLRVSVDVRRGEDAYTAWTSDDGKHFVRGGVWTHELGDDARLGLIAMAGSGFRATFEDVRTYRLRG